MRKKHLFVFTYYSLFGLYIIWWLWLNLLAPKDTTFGDYFADSYGILAGLGGFAGFYVARKWGSFNSFVGKALILLSAGLFSQFLGQLTYTVLFYIYQVENAYPSIGEVFFLASIPLYILGTWYLGKASGLSVSLASKKNKFVALLFPLIMVAASYVLFLRNYDFADLPNTIVLLDFVYPIGQALFVSSAILTFYMTKDLLGGIMRKKVVFVLFALVFQYMADTLFIYETRSETWLPGGLSDLVFVLSYFVMTIGFLSFQDIEAHLNGKKE